PGEPAAPRVKTREGRSGEGKSGEGDEDWLVTEKPSVRLSDIAGMEDVKAKLQEMVIKPLKHPDQARRWGIRPGGGILLYGPPGNGKTTLGKAVAGELEADFFYATGAEIRSKWHGESEQRLRKLIQAAKSRPVAVLFLDDVDGLLPRRGGNSTVDNRIVVQFLNEIGGFEESPNTLLVLGATNKPEDLDEGVFRTGRFDEKIFVGLPDQAAREFIVRKNLAEAPVDPALDPAAVATRLENYTGSDIVAVVQSAKRAGFRRAIEGGSKLLTVADIETAMKTIPSSATPELMREYERFAKARFK
ncbi:MAG: ATP-binding protein, partial [Verrucomicrobiota bacterium]